MILLDSRAILTSDVNNRQSFGVRKVWKDRRSEGSWIIFGVEVLDVDLLSPLVTFLHLLKPFVNSLIEKIDESLNKKITLLDSVNVFFVILFRIIRNLLKKQLSQALDTFTRGKHYVCPVSSRDGWESRVKGEQNWSWMSNWLLEQKNDSDRWLTRKIHPSVCFLRNILRKNDTKEWKIPAVIPFLQKSSWPSEEWMKSGWREIQGYSCLNEGSAGWGVLMIPVLPEEVTASRSH